MEILNKYVKYFHISFLKTFYLFFKHFISSPPPPSPLVTTSVFLKQLRNKACYIYFVHE